MAKSAIQKRNGGNVVSLRQRDAQQSRAAAIDANGYLVSVSDRDQAYVFVAMLKGKRYHVMEAYPGKSKPRTRLRTLTDNTVFMRGTFESIEDVCVALDELVCGINPDDGFEPGDFDPDEE